jgi:hypothetical protein
MAVIAGYQETPNSQELLDVLDSINIHMLPFFAFDASTGMSFSRGTTGSAAEV